MKLESLKKAHKDICGKSADMMWAKIADYTNGSEDVMKCLNWVEETTGVPPAQMVLARMAESLMRLRTFQDNGTLTVAGYSLDNSVGDLINWTVLLREILRPGESYSGDCAPII